MGRFEKQHLTSVATYGGNRRPLSGMSLRSLWFQSSRGGWDYRALNSICVGGRLGKPICVDPTRYFMLGERL
jgi:hypothetical protein